MTGMVYITDQNGDDWRMVYGIVLPTFFGCQMVIIDMYIYIYIRTTDIIKYSFSVGKTPFCWCWNVIMFYPRDCAKGEFHRHRHVTLPLSEDVGQRDQETHDLRENAGIDLGNSCR